MKNFILLLSISFSFFTNAQSLPDIKIMNEKGKMVPRDSFLKADKITVINFWANWCNPCKKEMIEINRIRVENDFKNIQFISISIDEFKDIEAAKTFFKTNKIPWKLYFDTKKEFFMKLLEITENSSTAIPISIVLDKKGNIVSFHSGFEQETYKADLLEDIHMIESGN
jgi:peroxiredoxin